TLTGYASGYISTILGETVIFKEVECSGMGAGACRWIGKTKKEWGDDVDEQLEYCQELPILKELELANQKLIEEKNNLAKVTQVHKLLTQEVIKGNNLESIAQVIYEQTGLSVLIENIHFQPLAYKGIEPEFLEELQEEFRQYLQDYQSLGKKFLLKTKVIDSVIGQRIVSPIFLQNEIVAYCSFFSKERVIQNQEIVTMFIERATSVCSLQLLNEKTRLESVERMKGRFLDEILNGKYTEKKEILKNASLIQLDLSQTYFMMAIEYKISSRNIKQELAIHERIFEEIVNYFKEGDLDALVEPKESKFIVLLANDGRSILENVRNLLKRLTKEFSGVLFQCGISLRNENIMEANEAYREALTALRMASSKMPAVTFDSLGVVGVLVNSNNKDAVVKMAKYTLGSLYDEKNEKKMELLRTLYVFLINGGNLEQTAEELALSVSGLRYRINKISSELNGDLRDAEENFQLLLSLKALKSIGVLEE
ncbi:MAG TPA: helix-turn-helix domain-containing protein, partial [Chondromyces sp.]|nr:helix-turn-helix domain-containing protein [Chondromyces sp.]